MRQKKIFRHSPRYMSNPFDDFHTSDVLILAGGKGTRLQSVVSDRPKVMAEVGGRPFLERAIDMLARHGFRRMILSVGYLKNQVIDHFRDYKPLGRENVEIVFSEEDIPLGTGGAVKRAKDLIRTDHFFVMNGDQVMAPPFRDLYGAHREKDALVSILLGKKSDASAYGRVEIDTEGWIQSFREKDGVNEEGLVNAGVYVMKKDAFAHMPQEDSFSIEYHFFPSVLGEYCHGFVMEDDFLDIGTPERYKEAQGLVTFDK